MEAAGYLNTRVVFDGETVTVVRRSKQVSFHVSDLASIEWKDARKWLNGTVQFVVPGASDRKQTGNYYTKTGNDYSRQYSVTFLLEQSDAMRAVCDAIRQARNAQRNGTGDTA